VSTETEQPSGPDAETLPDLVARLGRQLKSLGGAAAEPQVILAAANAAVDSIEARVDPRAPVLTDIERAALVAAQAMTFNAAADCWPGWEANPAKQPRSEVDLRGGLDLARRSFDLVHRLQLGALREGTAHWMVGAYQLALGEIDAAVAAFSVAVARHQAAGAPGLAWLGRGYIAIAYEAVDRPRPDGVVGFEEVLTAIDSGGFRDAASWCNQLNVARRIFT
jgi:hypothetical protein